MSFCCKVDVGERHFRHLAFQDEGPAIAEHRRGGDALQDGIDRDLARDAALLGERDRLAERDHLDHEQEIDRELHCDRQPALADVGDFRPDQQQHVAHALECSLVAADHDRGIALHDRDGAAGERRVEHELAGLGEFGGDGFADRRRDGAHVDEDAAAREPGENALLAERHFAHRLAVGDDAEDDFGLFGQHPWAVGPLHSTLEERRGFVPAPIPAGDGVAAGDQPWNDERPHGAEADETDTHPGTLPCRALLIFRP